MSANPMAELVAELRAGGRPGAPAVAVGDLRLTRGELWRDVDACCADLRASGVGTGAAVPVQVPPGVGYLVAVLAVMQLGACPLLLHHQLTEHERTQSLTPFTPAAAVVARPGQPASVFATDVALEVVPGDPCPGAVGEGIVQFTSGTTGRSRAVRRSVRSLRTELDALAATGGWVRGEGETVLVLNSLVHSFGLIGGLLHGLRVGAVLCFPPSLLPAALGATIAAHRPGAITGVPAHFELLTALPRGALDGVGCCVSGGQLVTPAAHGAFVRRHGVGLGQVYGLTELGLVAADFSGRLAPAMGHVLPGYDVAVESGEVLVRCAENPYLDAGSTDRWRAGWFATRDRGELAGRVLSVSGRLDSLVAVGGLKVDLTEVEHAIAAHPLVDAVVVVLDAGAVHAFVESGRLTAADVRAHLAPRLSPHKQPRTIEVRRRLARTAAGKLVRDTDRLRAAEAPR